MDKIITLAKDLGDSFEHPVWNAATVLLIWRQENCDEFLHKDLDKVLIIRSSFKNDPRTGELYYLAGRWGLIGETMETVDENFLALANRGVKEEIQDGVCEEERIKIPLEFFGVYFFINRFGVSCGSWIYSWYTSEEIPVFLSWEHDTYQWVTLQAALNMKLVHYHNQILEDLLIEKGDFMSRQYVLDIRKKRREQEANAKN